MIGFNITRSYEFHQLRFMLIWAYAPSPAPRPGAELWVMLGDPCAESNRHTSPIMRYSYPGALLVVRPSCGSGSCAGILHMPAGAATSWLTSVAWSGCQLSHSFQLLLRVVSVLLVTYWLLNALLSAQFLHRFRVGQILDHTQTCCSNSLLQLDPRLLGIHTPICR